MVEHPASVAEVIGSTPLKYSDFSLSQACDNSNELNIFLKITFFSFLLARHKAALEVYNEAAKLSTKDWVC